MESLFKTFLLRPSHSLLFQKIFRPQDPFSLETLSFRIRFALWSISLLYSLISPFTNDIKYPFFAYLPTPIFCLLELYLLAKTQNNILLGLPVLILTILMNMSLLQNQDLYLRVLMTSLGSIATYALQGYPPHFGLFFAFGYYWLQRNYAYTLGNLYEPITNSYRIPAPAMHSALQGWCISLALQAISLAFYQYIVRKMWSKYQEIRKDLEQNNLKLQETNLKLTKSLEELDLMNQELKGVIKSQDLFVACITHELRNPLNVIMGNIDILRGHTDTAKSGEILKTCRLGGETLLRQINNLLEVSKMKSKKFELNEVSINMCTFLDKFWSFVKIGLEKKNLSGYLQVDKNLPQVIKTDEHRLNQILDNLVGNAIKFTKEGSIRVTVRWIKGKYRMSPGISLEYSSSDLEELSGEEIFTELGNDKSARLPKCGFKKNQMGELHDFICFRNGDSVERKLEQCLPLQSGSYDNFMRIDVADSGCGILQEAQSKLFQPYTQADGDVSKKYGGTGLGLFIVKMIVERMRGIIKLDSMKNVGTRFQIMLPIVEESPVFGDSLDF